MIYYQPAIANGTNSLSLDTHFSNTAPTRSDLFQNSTIYVIYIYIYIYIYIMKTLNLKIFDDETEGHKNEDISEI